MKTNQFSEISILEDFGEVVRRESFLRQQ